MGALRARRRFATMSGSSFVESPTLCWQARNTLARLRRSLLLTELSLAKFSAYFWLNCQNFKSAELSLAEFSERGLNLNFMRRKKNVEIANCCLLIFSSSSH